MYFKTLPASLKHYSHLYSEDSCNEAFSLQLEMTVNLVASDFLSLLNSLRLVFQNGSVFFATVSWKRAASCAGVTDSCLPAANWAGGVRHTEEKKIQNRK